jgi:hypothetical protein
MSGIQFMARESDLAAVKLSAHKLIEYKKPKYFEINSRLYNFILYINV